MAGLRSVTFMSDTHIAIAKYKNGQIVVKKREKKLTKIGDWFYKIPFVRAYWILFEILFMNATGLILIGLDILFYLTFYKTSEKLTPTLNIILPYLPLTIILIALSWIKFSPVGKFHGAEHKTANCYWSNGNIEISEINKASRRSRKCGSNLAVSLVVIVGIFSILFKSSWMPMLLGWGISYELMRSDNKIIKKIAEPFFLLGDKFQQYVSTNEPTDKEIKAAIASIESLIAK